MSATKTAKKTRAELAAERDSVRLTRPQARTLARMARTGAAIHTSGPYAPGGPHIVASYGFGWSDGHEERIRYDMIDGLAAAGVVDVKRSKTSSTIKINALGKRVAKALFG